MSASPLTHLLQKLMSLLFHKLLVKCLRTVRDQDISNLHLILIICTRKCPPKHGEVPIDQRFDLGTNNQSSQTTL